MSERWLGGGRGEDRVRKSGHAEGGVVVGGDLEGARGRGVCASVNESVVQGDSDRAVGGDEDAVHFCA